MAPGHAWHHRLLLYTPGAHFVIVDQSECLHHLLVPGYVDIVGRREGELAGADAVVRGRRGGPFEIHRSTCHAVSGDHAEAREIDMRLWSKVDGAISNER